MGYWLKETYECVFNDDFGLTKLARGKIHEYLGITFDFSTNGKAVATMIPYVTEIVALFLQQEDSKKTTGTPADEHIFKGDDSATQPSPKQATIFHHFTAECLFLTKHS